MGGSSSPSEGDATAEAHAASCPRCGELARARDAVARELRGLARVAAPASDSSHGDATVDFAAVMAAVDGALDARLVRDEARWRPLLADLERIAMPVEAAAAVAARAIGPAPALVLRRARLVEFVRRAATVAAAAGVVATALLSRQAPPAREGLAAETRRLSDATPIEVKLVDVPAPTDATGAARLLGSSWMAPRGGGP